MPTTAGRRLTPLGSKSKEVYVWRYLSSLLFQAVHIYNLFCYMGVICFGMWDWFVLVYGSGLRVGDSTAPAARAGCLRQLGPKVKKYMYGGILVACYSKRCIFTTCFGVCERLVLVCASGLFWYRGAVQKLAVASLKLGILRRRLPPSGG